MSPIEFQKRFFKLRSNVKVKHFSSNLFKSKLFYLYNLQPFHVFHRYTLIWVGFYSPKHFLYNVNIFFIQIINQLNEIFKLIFFKLKVK